MIDKIAIHHFGPTKNSVKSAHLTESDINNAHRLRWPDFPSELNGSYIGYNCIIYPNGKMKQYRFLGEETAAQKYHNLDTFSICLAGNFMKEAETPTIEQKMRLKSLRGRLSGDVQSIGIRVKQGTTYQFSRKNIYPHRGLTPTTSCYGDSLSDSWARDLIIPFGEEQEKKELLTTLISLYRKLILLLRQKQLGNRLTDCSETDCRG